MGKWLVGVFLVIGMSLDCPCEPRRSASARPAVDDVCVVVQHWSAEVDGRAAVLAELDCDKAGRVRLVLVR